MMQASNLNISVPADEFRLEENQLKWEGGVFSPHFLGRFGFQ